MGTDSGSTAGNGAYTAIWFKDLADDGCDAWAVSLSHATDNWNQDLDVVNQQSLSRHPGQLNPLGGAADFA